MEFEESTPASRDGLCFRCLSWGLLVMDLDAFAIFSTRAKNSITAKLDKSKHYPAVKLIIEAETKLERPPKKLMVTFCRLFSIYLLIKLCLICFIQYDLLKASQCSKRRLLNSHCGWLSNDSLTLMVTLLGNPLAGLDDVAIQIYIGMILLIVCHLFVAPELSQHLEFDNPPLRLLLDPQFEITRIDSSIRDCIDKLIASLRVHKLKQAARYRELRAHCMSGVNLASRYEFDLSYLNEIHSSRLARDTLRRLRWSQDELEQLRPISLRPEHYTEMYSLFQSSFMMGALFSMVLPIIGMDCLYILTPVYTRCAGNLSACNLLRVLSWSEVLLIVELYIQNFLAIIIVLVDSFMSFLLVTSQLKLVRALRTDLGRCSRYLRDERRLDVRSDLLLKTLVKLNLSDLELRKNARSITRLANMQSYLMTTPIILIYFHESLKITDKTEFYWLLLSVSFLGGNVFALVYCYTTAQTTRLSSEFWSLLAACCDSYLDHYHPPPSMRNSQTKFGTTDTARAYSRSSFAANMLARFVIATNKDPKRYQASIVGLELNYNSLLQANTFLVFFYSFATQMTSEKTSF